MLKRLRPRRPRRGTQGRQVRGTGIGAGVGALALALLTACSSADSAPIPSVSYAGGPITEAQYVAIVTAVHDCMRAKGYQADDVRKRMDGVTYGFSFSGGTSGKSTNSTDDLSACELQYGLMEAEIAFQDQRTLTGAEREAVFADFADCMEAAGIAGLSSADDADAVQDRMAQLVESGGDDVASGSCWTQYSSQLFGASG